MTSFPKIYTFRSRDDPDKPARPRDTTDPWPPPYAIVILPNVRSRITVHCVHCGLTLTIVTNYPMGVDDFMKAVESEMQQPCVRCGQANDDLLMGDGWDNPDWDD